MTSADLGGCTPASDKQPLAEASPRPERGGGSGDPGLWRPWCKMPFSPSPALARSRNLLNLHPAERPAAGAVAMLDPGPTGLRREGAPSAAERGTVWVLGAGTRTWTGLGPAGTSSWTSRGAGGRAGGPDPSEKGQPLAPRVQNAFFQRPRSRNLLNLRPASERPAAVSFPAENLPSCSIRSR